MSKRMNKMLMTALVLLLNAAILTWAAEGSQKKDETQNSHSGRKEFTRTSDTENFTLAVGRESKSVTLVLNAKLTEGILRARVFDPAGISRGGFELTNDKSGEPAHGRFTPELPFATGVWKLRVERRDAAGSYDFRWTAR